LVIRFPQDCFAIRGNAMAPKSSVSRVDFRASGIRIPNDLFGIRMTALCRAAIKRAKHLESQPTNEIQLLAGRALIDSRP
ncbi:hypothetical protein, partial [Rhodoblastus sp.]|uniref:hypothetical protein n=1 Tax=Rhodoblastus sp. TaxID=1962975 RepID=UPI003FD8E6E8